MDLRRRLVVSLGGLLAGLLAVAILINLYSLRDDIAAEVAASEELAQVLLAAGQVEEHLSLEAAQGRLEAILAGTHLRHLSLAIEGTSAPTAPSGKLSWLAKVLGLATDGQRDTQGQVIDFGGQRLRIAPNPTSEIEERLGDTVRLCITLLFYSGATLLVAWWSAHRALAPVRELEAGLQRLARGEPTAALPAFALREFSQVAGAIDQLAAALATSRQAQRELSRQLIAVQEEERRTLARELHDEMGQTLTAISVTAAYLERNAGQIDSARISECAGDLRRDIRTSGEQLRAMLKRLRPHGLDAPGLAGALRELLASWQQRAAGIAFGLELPGELPVQDETVALVLYRVVQEALTNVVRHSGARHCRVVVLQVGKTLVVSITDDGQGLPADGAPRRGGLLGMQERLEMVGGWLEIDSGQGRGTTLRAGLPLHREERKEEQ